MPDTLTTTARRRLIGTLLVLPCTIVLLLMMAYPVVQTFFFSFSNIELPGFKLSFARLDNFVRAFTKPEVSVVIRNTIVWTLLSTFFRLLLGLLCALVMNANVPGVGVLRVIALLPWTMPIIVSSNSWRWMLASDYGVINGTLKVLGLDKLALNWLASSQTALGSVLVASTWVGYAFIMMMLLSAMQALSKDLYEAARIDGARGFQLFRYITLPGIRPVLLVVLTLETISAINAFDMIFVMTGGGPGGSTEIMGLFVYRLAFGNFDFGAASAVSVVLILIALVGFSLYGPARAMIGKKGDGTEGEAP